MYFREAYRSIRRLFQRFLTGIAKRSDVYKRIVEERDDLQKRVEAKEIGLVRHLKAELSNMRRERYRIEEERDRYKVEGEQTIYAVFRALREPVILISKDLTVRCATRGCHETADISDNLRDCFNNMGDFLDYENKFELTVENHQHHFDFKLSFKKGDSRRSFKSSTEICYTIDGKVKYAVINLDRTKYLRDFVFNVLDGKKAPEIEQTGLGLEAIGI